MYLRAVHADVTIAHLRQLIRTYPLGILTTAIPSDSYSLIQSSHIPFILDIQHEDDETELGVLRGHLARANPQTKAMIESLKSSPTSPAPNLPGVLQQEVQILFQSPAQHYVTPKLYTATKPKTGKVVPTWNYAAAQVYGRATIYHDMHAKESGEFLAKQIDDLSRYAEENIMGHTGTEGHADAWKVADAPESYIQALSKAIIGIEIKIDRMEGKFKMSQELAVEDRQGVIDGFQALGSEVGDSVAKLVEERGQMKDLKLQA